MKPKDFIDKYIEIHRYLCLWDGHVPDDFENFVRMNHESLMNDHAHGFDLYVGCPDEPLQYPEDFPEEVVQMLKLAYSHKCEWIRFDFDGPMIPTYPTRYQPREN